MGFDGITFAENGTQVTFLDILESNLSIVRRVCGSLNINNVDFLYLEKESSLESLQNDFDFIWCQGSLINAPKEIIRQEVQSLLKHLKDNGRWVELAYPKRRWEKQGKKKFDRWGEKTDGGAPWIEWYESE